MQAQLDRLRQSHPVESEKPMMRRYGAPIQPWGTDLGIIGASTRIMSQPA